MSGWCACSRARSRAARGPAGATGTRPPATSSAAGTSARGTPTASCRHTLRYGYVGKERADFFLRNTLKRDSNAQCVCSLKTSMACKSANIKTLRQVYSSSPFTRASERCEGDDESVFNMIPELTQLLYRKYL